jgi:hypothetical protein
VRRWRSLKSQTITGRRYGDNPSVCSHLDAILSIRLRITSSPVFSHDVALERQLLFPNVGIGIDSVLSFMHASFFRAAECAKTQPLSGIENCKINVETLRHGGLNWSSKMFNSRLPMFNRNDDFSHSPSVEERKPEQKNKWFHTKSIFMEKRILEQIEFTVTLLSVFHSSINKIAAYPKLGSKILRLDVLNTRVGESAEKYTNARNGTADAKTGARERLESLLCGGFIYVYAKVKSLHVAMELTDVTATWVSHLRDAELGILGQSIAKQQQDICKSIEDYGITEAIVKEMKIAADQFAIAKTVMTESISCKQDFRTEIVADRGVERIYINRNFAALGLYNVHAFAPFSRIPVSWLW